MQDPNTTYGTESENFATITSKNAQGNGPEWFEVLTNDDVKIEYGQSLSLVHPIVEYWILVEQKSNLGVGKLQFCYRIISPACHDVICKYSEVIL